MSATTPLIFVQIVSYRDPRLLPTIEDLLAKASHPEQFTFGICWQYGPEENPDVFDGRNNFRVYKAPYTESKGVGWARSITNSLYKGEEYTLQLDSHHRFVQGWDAMLMQDYRQAKEMSDNPIITTYAPPLEADLDGTSTPPPTIIGSYEFSPDKLLVSRPVYLQEAESRACVIRSRTVSGHFLFTEGAFVQRVPSDPAAFYGSYIIDATLSARAFTHGYDFFSPFRTYVMHAYASDDRHRIWEDKPADSLRWDMHARNKARQLQGQEDHNIDLGMYGLGTRRTFHDWEIFSGFDFVGCRIQQFTTDGREPPNPVPWSDQFATHMHVVTVLWSSEKIQDDVSKQAPRVLRALILGIQNADGGTIYRIDMNEMTHPAVFKCDTDQLRLTVNSTMRPVRWVMWPLFEDNVWGSKQEGAVTIEETNY